MVGRRADNGSRGKQRVMLFTVFQSHPISCSTYLKGSRSLFTNIAIPPCFKPTSTSTARHNSALQSQSIVHVPAEAQLRSSALVLSRDTCSPLPCLLTHMQCHARTGECGSGYGWPFALCRYMVRGSKSFFGSLMWVTGGVD